MPNHVQIPSETSAFFTPTIFTRHNRFLHAFMQDHEAWFCVQDLGRLMGYPLNERLTLKLDPTSVAMSFCVGTAKSSIARWSASPACSPCSSITSSRKTVTCASG